MAILFVLWFGTSETPSPIRVPSAGECCRCSRCNNFFCFLGTGTNVCYMEEVKNIEKSKTNTGKMQREETTPGSEGDKVRETMLSISCGLKLNYIFLVYVCIHPCHFCLHRKTMVLKVGAWRGMLRSQKCV